ncbi:NXPE family member 3-like [Notolabrus celidotus]|uniref:NXPE family member 3-like n=1 Tax=Notolabrus celidotus TaxID=1203425 RepID=UPI00148FC616|nr:NXPE family member 3-like [Notolabrus celidotus]
MDPPKFKPKLPYSINFKNISTDPPKTQGFCTFKPLPPAEAQEERHFLDLIALPETPLVPTPLSLEQMSHPANSTFTILPKSGGGEWHVGDQLEVLIKMFDFQGHAKKTGGDFLVAALHSKGLGAGVTGRVVDHLNGSYSALFPLLWEGSTRVEVILLHTSEAVTVLRMLNIERPDRVIFKGVFRSGSVSETTVCNVCLPPSNQSQCNYTDLHTGDPWFCYKPQKLSCEARVSHRKTGYKYQGIKNEKEKLFQKGVNLKVYIKASGPDSVTVLPQTGDAQEINLNNPVRVGPFMILDNANNFVLTYRIHGLPLRMVSIPASKERYVANELDGLIGGTNTVVVLSVWAHFSTFPFELFIRRMQSIRRAVVRLLDRAPGTLVVIRTGNVQTVRQSGMMNNSDWYVYQINLVLRAMFKGLNVQWIDAWGMVLAHDLAHNLHPPPPIIKNMVNVLLSYICPKK